jgi:hypothetical protein
MASDILYHYPLSHLQDAHDELIERLHVAKSLDEYRDVSDLIRDVEVELCWRKRG